MDRAKDGKNGVINHVLRAVNPAGLRLASFTAPTPGRTCQPFPVAHQQTASRSRHDRRLQPVPQRRPVPAARRAVETTCNVVDVGTSSAPRLAGTGWGSGHSGFQRWLVRHGPTKRGRDNRRGTAHPGIQVAEPDREVSLDVVTGESPRRRRHTTFAGRRTPSEQCHPIDLRQVQQGTSGVMQGFKRVRWWALSSP